MAGRDADGGGAGGGGAHAIQYPHSKSSAGRTNSRSVVMNFAGRRLFRASSMKAKGAYSL